MIFFKWLKLDSVRTNINKFKKLFAYMYLMKKMPLQHQVVDYHSVMLLMSTEQDQTQCYVNLMDPVLEEQLCHQH